MKILHLSKYDRKGGAAIAAFNAMLAQREQGLDSRMSVAARLSDHPHVFTRSGPFAGLRRFANFAVERLPGFLAGVPVGDTRSIGLGGRIFEQLAADFDPDIVVMHNIDGLMPIEQIARIPKPIVWRLHDMWAFSGTKHYAGGNWLQQPSRFNGLLEGLDRWTFARKMKALAAHPNLTLCPPSYWLGDEASRVLAANGLDLPIRVITNGVDSAVFAPIDRVDARKEFGVRHDKPVIVFGAASGNSDPRKGYDLLERALTELATNIKTDEISIVTFGGNQFGRLPDEFNAHNLGAIHDRKQLSKIYALSDLCVVASREENLSLTVLEAMSCGTAVVAFDIGGMPDMIENGSNGFLIPPFDTSRLASVLLNCVTNPRQIEEMGTLARKTIVERFDRMIEAKEMLELFEEITARNNSS